MPKHLTESVAGAITATHTFTTGTCAISPTGYFKTDVISEYTSGSGVTIDSVLLKDNVVTATTFTGTNVTGTTVTATTGTVATLGSTTAIIASLTGTTLRANNLGLATGATVIEFSIDDTFGGNSDTVVPTEKAIKTYVASVSPIPSGTKMLFYANTAPTGWTIDNTMDDKMVFVTKGSVAGGETGGGVHSTGTWTVAGLTNAAEAAHTHTGPSHAHTLKIGYYAGTIYMGGESAPGTDTPTTHTYTTSADTTAFSAAVSWMKTETDGTGNTGAGTSHNHAISSAGTWRPASYNFIVCTKD